MKQWSTGNSMVENKQEISYSISEVIQVLKDLNLIVVSFNKIAMASVDNKNFNLAGELLKFIQDRNVLEKLASARLTLSVPIDDLKNDYAINLEKIMEGLPYWSESDID